MNTWIRTDVEMPAEGGCLFNYGEWHNSFNPLYGGRVSEF